MKKIKINMSSFGKCALVAAAILATPVFAGWNASQQNISGMNTWIHNPEDTGQKRALMLVLHGCAQSNTDIKSWGNLANASENFNAVMVVPYRPTAWTGNASANCWAYDGGDSSQATEHANALIGLATTIINDSTYNIDPNRVYVSGLSSGAGMSLVMGCKAPDIFSGVDSVAGPTVGSAQFSALSSPIESSAISTGISKCNSLASGKASYLTSQITHVTWGQMDKDGEAPGQAYSQYGSNPAGQTALVSAKYSHANYKVMKDVYGSSVFSSEVRVTEWGGSGSDQASSVNGEGKVKVTYLAMDDVGHAWPAAQLGASVGNGGIWMAQHDIDYPSYILNWFESNNLREPFNEAPVVTITSSSSTSSSATADCTATDADGTVVQIDSQLLQNGNVIDNHPNIASCSDTYTGLAEGFYKIKFIATDDGNATDEETTESIQVGNPPDLPPVVSANGSSNAQDLSVSGSVSDDIGLASVTADLMQGGSVVSSQSVTVAGDDSYNVTFADVAEGTYTIRVTAVDTGSNSEDATTGSLLSEDLGSTGNVQFHIDEGHITFGFGYSTCYLEYGSSAAFTMSEVDQGSGNCQWQDDDNSCSGPVQTCSNPGPTPDPTPTATPTPTPTPLPGCTEVTAFNYYHKTGGRAYSAGNPMAPDYFANGSDDAMAGSTWGSITLHTSDDSYWEVGACP